MEVSLNKVSANKNISFAQNQNKKNVEKPVDKPLTSSAQDCLSQMGKAQVRMQVSAINADDEIRNVVEKVAKKLGTNVFLYVTSNNIVRLGKPIEGFSKLCSDDYRAKCNKDENGKLKEIFVVDLKNKNVMVFNADGEQEKEFSQEDMKALHEYKYSPESFHKYLRHGRTSYMPSQEELESYILAMDNLFADDENIWRTETPKTVYRALPSYLSDEQIDNLSSVGGIYEEKSFVSTSEKYNVAKRFKGIRPILEIELPKNSKYLPLDDIFNIDSRHWHEQEFLLDRNSEFLVTGYDKEKDIIKVKYLNKN